MFGYRYPSYRLLAFDDGLAVDYGFQFRLEGRGGLLHDLAFLIARRVIDDHLKKETVSLGFGKMIGAFLLDRVLGGQNEEGFLKVIGLPANGHVVFLHGLEQGGLCLWRSTIDFISQYDLAENRTFLKY